MRKEMFLAVALGLVFGLIVTFGVYRARQPQTQPNRDVLSQSATPSPGSDTATLANLSVTSPNQDGLVVSESNFTIAGTTTPNTFVVVYVQDDDNITTADETGSFAVDVELENLSNVITIQTIDEDGQTAQLRRVIIVEPEPDNDPINPDNESESDEE